MRKLIAALSGRGDLGVLLVRLVLAEIVIIAGYQKFFGYGLEKLISNFGGYGIPVPQVLGPLIAALELGGGILLALGLFSRYLGVLFFFEFIVAAYVKWSVIQPPAGGYGAARLDTLIIVVAILIATHGAGRYSLDHKLGRWDR